MFDTFGGCVFYLYIYISNKLLNISDHNSFSHLFMMMEKLISDYMKHMIVMAEVLFICVHACCKSYSIA